MAETLVINEIYLSLQGESTFAGLPCVFVRLTACNLRCSYCDTAYAFTEGRKMLVSEVRQEVLRLGEPFRGEIGGAHRPRSGAEGGPARIARKNPCEALPSPDLDEPSSGEVARNRWENIPCLKSDDEVKFVIGTVQDYEWARATIAEHKLTEICPVLFSWVAPLTAEQQDKSLKKVPEGHTPLTRRELAERIIADALPVRFQVQMHKVIWAPDARGV